MSVKITKEDLIAYSEVNYIIQHMNERYISKVPKNIITFFETMSDDRFDVYVNPRKPLYEQGLQKYTLEIIALLNIKYWCTDQDRRNDLIEKMQENQRKLEAQMNEVFSTNNIFKNKVDSENDAKVSKKDPVLTKYSEYKEENPDIQDYTDVQEPPEVQNVSEESSIVEKNEEKKSIFSKIKTAIKNIFSK